MKDGKRLQLKEVILLSILAALSMITKPYVHAAFAPFVRSFNVPVGVLAGSVYMAWVVMAGIIVPSRGATVLFCAIQGGLAVLLGMGGALGAFVPLSYIAPGVAIELLYALVPVASRSLWVYGLAGAAANLTGAVVNSVLFFQLRGRVLAIWAIPSAITGAVGGLAAYLVAQRVVLTIRHQVREQHR
ncbi:MAG: ECF transporter S component [Bacillota bacterium]